MNGQLDIFSLGCEPLKIDKPIRLIELFAGYGSQALSLKYLGVPFEHHRICEWAVPSIQAYKDLHFTDDNIDYSKNLSIEQVVDFLVEKGISTDYNKPSPRKYIERLGNKARTIYNNIIATNNLVSVCNTKGEDLAITDTDKFTYLLTYSFPCFVGDSMVLTDKGYKKIIDIEIGDFVLTLDNSYQKVVNKFDNGKHQIYSINGMAIDEIKATENHKFYVRTMYRKGHYSIRSFEQPKWKELKHLTKNDYLGIAINQNSIIPKWNGIDFVWKDGRKSRHKNELEKYMNNKDFWWLIGRYIGDGWQRPQGGIVICCNKNEKREIEQKLNSLFNYCCIEDKTVLKFHIPIKEIQEFVKDFGKGAKNKRLTNTIIDLPCDLLESFIQGYFSADGCYDKGLYKATSISRELIYGIGQCVAKVYKTPYRIYKTKRPKTYEIEGRTVNQNDTYQIAFKTEKCKQDKAFYENGYIWYPIKSIDKIDVQNVYDIEVENNHSFTVQNTIVHNCQDLSGAGQRKGMEKGSGTRSGLLWEVERILSECNQKPQILLMENVPEVVGEKNRKSFDQWVQRLDEWGYKSWWQIINGTDFGMPQNRKRCFMVSVLGDYYYTFPYPTGCELRLKDLLEPNVDEKYYLSERALKGCLSSTFDSSRLENRIEHGGAIPTLCARDIKTLN